jgi:hypothetical protein
MSRIWILDADFNTDAKLAASDCDRDVDLIIDFKDEFADEIFSGGPFQGQVRYLTSTRPELDIPVEDFDADYFKWDGWIFVSERMRQAMALPPSAAHFVDVDSSRSAAMPRSKNYQIMEPTVFEAVLDPEASDYAMTSADYYRDMLNGEDADRELIQNMLALQDSNSQMIGAEPESDLGPQYIRRLAVRQDTVSAHDLVYDRFFKSLLLCTEAFAARVLKAGCTGMRFMDPTTYRGEEGQLFRTARGVERVTWDPEKQDDVAELVEVIE